jgi:DNA-binding SARP family transcriptional activator
LLGTWRLTFADGSWVAVPPSGQRIIAFLALHDRQLRARVAAIIWPEVADDRASRRLRSTVWKIQQSVRGLLDLTDGCLGLSAEVSVDVNRFAAVARDAVENRPVELAPNETIALLDSPELLLGWYEDWVVEERERLNMLRVLALEALARRLIESGLLVEGLETAQAAVRWDPTRESAHRAVIEAHLAAGNPASAVHQYNLYCRLLRDEFGIDHPTAQLISMIESMR